MDEKEQEIPQIELLTPLTGEFSRMTADMTMKKNWTMSTDFHLTGKILSNMKNPSAKVSASITAWIRNKEIPVT